MISEKMQAALNEQVNKEFYSAYLYLAMSAYSNEIGLQGFANWMRMQFEEEMMHASKMYDYILDQGGQVHLKQIDEPPLEYGSPLEIFEQTLKHEQFVTDSINKLMSVAVQEQDFATQTFLQWYVTEQVEEEANVNDILAPLRMVGDDKSGLVMIDRQLAERAPPTAPAPAA